MWAAHRGPAERHHLENTVTFQAWGRLSGSASRHGDDSAQRANRKQPTFVSFVSKAVLWERKARTYSLPVRPALRPSPCPRFLSHMKKENLKAPPMVTLVPALTPPPHTTRTRPPEGSVPLGSDGGTRRGSRAERRLRVVSPPLSTFRSKPLLPPLLRGETADGRRGIKLNSAASPTSSPSELIRLPPSLFSRSEDLVSGRSSFPRAPNYAGIPAFDSSSRRSLPTGGLLPPVSVSVSETTARPSSSSPSHVLPLIHEPHEDLLGFSCAADEAGSAASDSLILIPSLTSGALPPVSAKVTEAKAHPSWESPSRGSSHEDLLSVPLAADEAAAETSGRGSSSRWPSLIGGFLDPVSETKPPQPSKSPTRTPPLTDEHCSNRALTIPPRSLPVVHDDREHLLSCGAEKDELQHESKAPGFEACSSEENRVPSALSCAASHPSPQMVSPVSEIRAASPSPHWSILPPISALRGGSSSSSSSSSSCCSEISCSQSHLFDEVDALAPPSPSASSLDQLTDSSGRRSPGTGLDALALACDSGNLGSLSRIRLLLLDRAVLESGASPPGLEEEEGEEEEEEQEEEEEEEEGEEEEEEQEEEELRPGWSSGSSGVRNRSAGKVQDQDSGSSSSWIVRPSPTTNLFSSSQSDHGSHTQGRDKDSAGGEGPDRREVLSVLAKLQQETPRQGRERRERQERREGQERQERQEGQGRSNFEDFDFLSKFCIFSREKLAEYGRVFQAVDSDQDGFLSFPQVLDALKRIVPAELLSDDEQVYIYRILEMVDLRVMGGLVDLRLFCVVSSLAERISSMDDFLRSLLATVDFRSLEVKLFKAKQLFLFLAEDQSGLISGEQLLLELKAGGIRLQREDAVLRELRRKPPLDLLDFLAHLPLFLLVHSTVVSNPLNDGGGGGDKSSIT